MGRFQPDVRRTDRLGDAQADGVGGSLRRGHGPWHHGLVFWSGILLTQAQYEMIAPYFSTEGAYCPLARDLTARENLSKILNDMVNVGSYGTGIP
jgi:hypothetical protein